MSAIRAFFVILLGSGLGLTTGLRHVQAAPAPADAVRVTRVIKEVALLRGETRQSAVASAAVLPGTFVRTGHGSRAELSLGAGALVRLGGNTLLNFRNGAGGMALEDGAVLLDVPRGSPAVRIQTGAVTVEIAGATALVDRHARAYLKVLALQGNARVFVASKIGESVLLDPGQILITNPEAKALPEAVDFDIAQLYKTSLLTNRDFAPLASQSRIEREIARQKKDPALIPTNLVIYGRGTLVTLAGSEGEGAAQKASPSPTPSSSPKAKPKK